MKGFLRSRKVHTALGFGVSLVLIGWMFWSVDWSGVAGEFSRFQWWALIPCVALLVGHFYLRAWRWRYLLPDPETPTRAVSLQQLFDSLIVGAFGTFVLPLRAGEFIRPYMLTRGSSYSFSTAFVSVVVERFFDLAVVLGAFALVAGKVPEMPAWASAGASLLSVPAVAILALMVVGSFFPDAVLNLLDRLLRFLPATVAGAISVFAEEFLEGAAVLRRGSKLLMVVLLSLLIWASCFVQCVSYFWLFGEQGSLLVATTVSVIVALAVAAPSAPGFIGVYQVAIIAGFRLFGLSEPLAVAFSIASHLIQYVFFVIYGMSVLSRSHLKLGALRQESLQAG